MAFTFLIFIALIGAAILAFICAWYLQQGNVEKGHRENEDIASKLKEKQTSLDASLKTISTQKMTIENLQKQLQVAEYELIQLQTELRVKEGDISMLEKEKSILANENALLEEELKSNINEIEIVREIPPDPPQEKQQNELSEKDLLVKRIEKAKRLVSAFKKGVSENTNTPAKGS